MSVIRFLVFPLSIIFKFVTDIRNIGLIGAIELKPIDGMPTKRAFNAFLKAFEKGCLIRTTGDIIALSPPLIIKESQIEEGLCVGQRGGGRPTQEEERGTPKDARRLRGGNRRGTEVGRKHRREEHGGPQGGGGEGETDAGIQSDIATCQRPELRAHQDPDRHICEKPIHKPRRKKREMQESQRTTTSL